MGPIQSSLNQAIGQAVSVASLLYTQTADFKMKQAQKEAAGAEAKKEVAKTALWQETDKLVAKTPDIFQTEEEYKAAHPDWETSKDYESWKARKEDYLKNVTSLKENYDSWTARRLLETDSKDLPRYYEMARKASLNLGASQDEKRNVQIWKENR